jgi:hypothetical protein
MWKINDNSETDRGYTCLLNIGNNEDSKKSEYIHVFILYIYMNFKKQWKIYDIPIGVRVVLSETEFLLW